MSLTLTRNLPVTSHALNLLRSHAGDEPGNLDWEPMERLLNRWSHCSVVHAMHHAVRYRTTLHHTDERSRAELSGLISFLLRKAPRYLHES